MTVTPPTPQEPGPPVPSLQSWRTTTAVRVFALALATGTAVSDSVLVRVLPILVVLATLEACCSLLEWLRRDHPMHWHAVLEAVATTILLVVTQSVSALGACLAVPAIIAGVRFGLVTTLNVSLVSGLTVAATLATSSPAEPVARFGETVPWLLIGLGVGALTSWQSRETRDLAARQAPYATANQLMARIHQLASSGSLGLDSTSLATSLEEAMRVATGCARTTVFVVDPDDSVRPLNVGPDAERLARELKLSDAERTPGVAVVPLRGARQVLGHCVLVGISRWTEELDRRALEVADDFALRLDTAVLFDDVRLLATAEERNRIARDMHDGVAQEIVALGYVVDEIESTADQDHVKELAAGLRAEITRMVSEIRFSIFDLRHQLVDARLSGPLADYVRETSRATGMQVHLSLEETGPPLTPRVADDVLRIAQEAINNVRKHARADNLWVSFASDGTTLHLEVGDDGVGRAERRQHHWGLQSMHERAERVGARLEIGSRAGRGTVVTLRSPVITTTATSEGERAHEHHRAAR